MKRWYVSSTVLVVVALAAVMVFGVGTAAAFQGTLEGGWYWQNPLVQGNGFNDVSVIGSSAVAVGDAGSVFTSADRGTSWTRRPVWTPNSPILKKVGTVPLLAVDFVNSSTGWAVGYRAINSANATTIVTSAMLKTTDGGVTWAAQDLPDPRTVDPLPVRRFALTDVSFVDENDGWATANYSVTGGRTICAILRTINGGASWQVANQWQSPISAQKDAIQLLSQVDFVNATTGWATGWGYDASKPLGHQWGYVVLSTTDGGATWAISQFGDGQARISAMDFTSASDGWLATASLADYAPATIWRTTDGGATWSAKTTKQGATITGLAASPSGECYATGQTQGLYDWEGFVLHSTDAGATWSQEFAQQGVRPLAVGFSSTAAVVVGSGGLFLHRNFATGAWTDSTAGVRTNLTKVQFKDANLGWAVGWKSTILRTTNGGRDWKTTSVPSGISLEGLDMVTSKVGWAVGCSGPHVPYADLDAGYGAVVLRTTDGGLHWKYQVNRNTRPGLAAVDFTDTKHGVAVGTNGFVARTTNGGRSWWYRTVGSTTLRSIAFTAASTGVAVGGETGSVSGNGVIWKTTDGGVTWANAKPQPTPTAPLRSVKFDSKTGLTAIGDNEQIYTSADAGATWSYTPIWAGGIVQDPPFAHFMDSGATTIPTTALVATNDVNGWALSDNGLVWTSGRAAAVWQSSESAKAITGFSFRQLSPPVIGSISEADHTINLLVPFGTDIRTLVASFTTTGASVIVSGKPQVSGFTANDFRSRLTYVVKAVDGSTQDYAVNVMTATAFASFSFQQLSPPVIGSIGGASHTVRLIVPFATDVSALVASFTTAVPAAVTVGGTPQVSGLTANDFTDTLVYTVTAANGVTQDCKVTVASATAASVSRSAQRLAAGAVTVTGFTPASGVVGSKVIITGSGFTGATSVVFTGGVPAAFIVDSDSQVTAVVPVGAVSGSVSVTTPGGTGTSATAFVVGSAVGVSSFTPAASVVGAKVTIAGWGFTGATSVVFTSGVSATFTVDSDLQITAVVPAGAVSGPVSVTTPNGTGMSDTDFTVIPTEHLLDHEWGSGQDNQLNSIAVVDWLNVWAVGERGTILSFDRLAPTTTISPSNGWVKSPMMSLSATDPKSGVAWTRWVVDPPDVVNDPTLGPIYWDAWDWQYGTAVTFSTIGDAPGTKHVVYYQSLDNVNNIELDPYWLGQSGRETPKHLWVAVDSIGPQTHAPATATVARGQHPALAFWVNDDLSNRANVTIVVRDSGGRNVKTLNMGWLATWQQFSSPITDWKCTLAKGAYTFSVYAKDQAGNDQAVLGSNTLTVR